MIVRVNWTRGSPVLLELRQETREGWRLGPSTLETFGFLEKFGESVRGGRRAYYRMLELPGVEAALAEPRCRKIFQAASVRQGTWQ